MYRQKLTLPCTVCFSAKSVRKLSRLIVLEEILCIGGRKTYSFKTVVSLKAAQTSQTNGSRMTVPTEQQNHPSGIRQRRLARGRHQQAKAGQESQQQPMQAVHFSLPTRLQKRIWTRLAATMMKVSIHPTAAAVPRSPLSKPAWYR